MRLIKLIVPAVLIAVLALFAPHADAQTMGEYARTNRRESELRAARWAPALRLQSDRTTAAEARPLGEPADWAAVGVTGPGPRRLLAWAWISNRGRARRRADRPGDRAGQSPVLAPPIRRADSRFIQQIRRSGSIHRSLASCRRRQIAFPATSLNNNRTGLDSSYNAINNF